MNVLVVVPNFPNRIKEYLVLPSLELCIVASILKNNKTIVSKGGMNYAKIRTKNV